MQKTDDVLMKLHFQSHVNLIARLVVVYVKTVHIIIMVIRSTTACSHRHFVSCSGNNIYPIIIQYIQYPVIKLLYIHIIIIQCTCSLRSFRQ